MNVKIFPVVLHCSNEELIRHIQPEDRYKEKKITDPYFTMKRIRVKRLLIPKGAFEIDNSNLSAKEVAQRIVKKIKSKKLIVTSVVKSLKNRVYP
ncbi:MAG: hypothetical protein PV340_03980 [Wolbachia sp.]|nr:hypothetical protein [Wolbachia sp.]MDD9336812.1 hypothetical protein [Wolbachia sp.]